MKMFQISAFYHLIPFDKKWDERERENRTEHLNHSSSSSSSKIERLKTLKSLKLKLNDTYDRIYFLLEHIIYRNTNVLSKHTTLFWRPSEFHNFQKTLNRRPNNVLCWQGFNDEFTANFLVGCYREESTQENFFHKSFLRSVLKQPQKKS